MLAPTRMGLIAAEESTFCLGAAWRFALHDTCTLAYFRSLNCPDRIQLHVD